MTEQRPTAFVAMWYHEPYLDLYNTVIEPELRTCGFTPLRADRIPRSSDITTDILRAIGNADLVVAECTAANQNVEMEIGIALALNKEIILLAQEGAELPVIRRNRRHFLYNSSTLKLQFHNWIEETSAYTSYKRGEPKRTTLQRGEVREGLFNASVNVDHRDRGLAQRIRAEIREHCMLSCSDSYFTENGARHWLALCNDPLYHPFRDSILLLEKNADVLMNSLSDEFLRTSPTLLSLGPGNGVKDRILARALIRNLQQRSLPSEVYYYPVDISPLMLATTVDAVAGDPEVGAMARIHGILGDFSKIAALRPVYDYQRGAKLFCLLGNTLGNTLDEKALLGRIVGAMDPGDVLMLEVRRKTASNELGGRSEEQFGLSFAPLRYLGVPYEEKKIAVRHRQRLSTIPNTETVCVYYNELFIDSSRLGDVFLSCVHFYDIEELRQVLREQLDDTEVVVIEGEFMALLLSRKEGGKLS